MLKQDILIIENLMKKKKKESEFIQLLEDNKIQRTLDDMLLANRLNIPIFLISHNNLLKDGNVKKYIKKFLNNNGILINENNIHGGFGDKVSKINELKITKFLDDSCRNITEIHAAKQVGNCPTINNLIWVYPEQQQHWNVNLSLPLLLFDKGCGNKPTIDFDPAKENNNLNITLITPPTATNTTPPTVTPPTATPPTAITPPAIPPTAIPSTAIPPTTTDTTQPTIPPIQKQVTLNSYNIENDTNIVLYRDAILNNSDILKELFDNIGKNSVYIENLENIYSQTHDKFKFVIDKLNEICQNGLTQAALTLQPAPTLQTGTTALAAPVTQVPPTLQTGTTAPTPPVTQVPPINITESERTSFNSTIRHLQETVRNLNDEKANNLINLDTRKKIIDIIREKLDKKKEELNKILENKRDVEKSLGRKIDNKNLEITNLKYEFNILVGHLRSNIGNLGNLEEELKFKDSELLEIKNKMKTYELVLDDYMNQIMNLTDVDRSEVGKLLKNLDLKRQTNLKLEKEKSEIFIEINKLESNNTILSRAFEVTKNENYNLKSELDKNKKILTASNVNIEALILLNQQIIQLNSYLNNLNQEKHKLIDILQVKNTNLQKLEKDVLPELKQKLKANETKYLSIVDELQEEKQKKNMLDQELQALKLKQDGELLKLHEENIKLEIMNDETNEKFQKEMNDIDKKYEEQIKILRDQIDEELQKKSEMEKHLQEEIELLKSERSLLFKDLEKNEAEKTIEGVDKIKKNIFYIQIKLEKIYLINLQNNNEEQEKQLKLRLMSNEEQFKLLEKHNLTLQEEIDNLSSNKTNLLETVEVLTFEQEQLKQFIDELESEYENLLSETSMLESSDSSLNDKIQNLEVLISELFENEINQEQRNQMLNHYLRLCSDENQALKKEILFLKSGMKQIINTFDENILSDEEQQGKNNAQKTAMNNILQAKNNITRLFE